MKVTRCLLAMVMGAALVTSAQGQTVLIDFGSAGSFRGVNVPNPDVNGNTWNSIVPGLYYPNLVDTTNTATTIDFGFSTPVGTDSFNGPAGVTSIPPTAGEIAATDIDVAALGILGVKEAAIDFAAEKNTRFEIQGLDPAKTYNLKLFGSHKYSDDATTVYSVYTDNTYTSLVATGNLNVQNPSSPDQHNRDTVLTLNGLAPQASNILYVQFTGANGNFGYLNSLAITAVPEPTSMLLLAGGAALVVGYGRRRAAQA